MNIRYLFSIVSPSGNGGQSGNLLGLLMGQPGPQGPIYVDNNNNIGPNGCSDNEPSDCAQSRCSERLRQARVSTWWGPMNAILSLCDYRLSGGDTKRWCGYSNPTSCK